MTQPAQDWFSQNAPPAAKPTGDWFSQNARPATSDSPELSFMQRAATQPSEFSHLNPLRYFDELGQGMAAGAEMLAHPVDTAQKLYKTAMAPHPMDFSDASNKPLAQQVKEGADTLAQGYGQEATIGAASKALELGVPAAGRAVSAVASGVKPALRAIGPPLTAAGETLNPDLVGIISPRAANALRLIRKTGKVATALGEEKPVYPGAPFPEVPAQALMQSRALGAQPAEPEAPMSTPSGEGLPRTLQGDSALRKILTGQDNANLMKIAKSRGINVARESQLKPGAADNLLINKIIDDFKPEELDEIRDRYIESTRFRHDFGDIGPDAWKTISLQTYFPELKLPKTAIAKTHASILKAAGTRIEKAAPADEEDLTGILQQSLAAVKARP